MRPRAALRYAEIGEEVGKILRRHGAAAVGVHRELCWIDAFSHDRAGEEILGQRGAFACFQAPRDDVPAKHVEHDVEMIICPLLRTKQLGDVPGPNAVGGRRGELGLHMSRMRRQPPPLTRFACGMQHTIHRRDGTEVTAAFVQQHGVDLANAKIGKAFAMRDVEDYLTLAAPKRRRDIRGAASARVIGLTCRSSVARE